MMVNVAFIVRLRTTLRAASKMLLVTALLIASAVSGSIASATPASAQAPDSAVGRHFIIENVGQFAAEARFQLKQGGKFVWLTGDAVWLTVPDVLPEDQWLAPGVRRPGEVGRERHPAAIARPGTAIRFTFPGANGAPALEPYGQWSTRISYLIGSDPARWRQDVPAWSGVRYRDLYPGVDLVIGDGAAGTLPWRLEAQPGADVSAVALRIEGADAATTEAGALLLDIKDQTIEVALPGWAFSGEPRLVESTGAQQPGASLFALAPGAQPAASAPDAVAAGDLIYQRSLAGALYDAGYAIAADSQGNTYITGETQSTNLPVTPGSFDPTNSATTDPTEAFVAKYDPNGTAPLYLTYLGGGKLDVGWGIALSGGLAFVAGETQSTDFPGMSGTVAGTDMFVAALNDRGTGVRYVSRLGGSAYEAAYAIAVEGLEAYIVGTTRSTNLPATNCSGSASGDLVVAKFGSLGGAPVYATCLVSSTSDAGFGIAARGGAAYVTGEMVSSNRDMTVARLDTGGAFVGGIVIERPGDDWGKGIAVDTSGNIYVAGTTASANFPVTAGTAPWGGGATDAVILKMHADETAMVIDFATFLGGAGDDEGHGIAVDTVQAMYVAGATTSNPFPMTPGAYDVSFNGVMDVFVARMHLGSTEQDKVTYATYLDGAYEDWAYGATTDTGGHAFVTGSSASSANFDSTNAFVAKVKVSSPPAAPVVSISTSGTNVTLSWGAVSGSSKYQVFRSNTPYFQPGDWSSTLRAEPTTTSYQDAGALSTVNAYFYVVKAVNASPAASANSNRVGKFTYQLVKGTN
jgi:hypothetical protein